MRCCNTGYCQVRPGCWSTITEIIKNFIWDIVRGLFYIIPYTDYSHRKTKETSLNYFYDKVEKEGWGVLGGAGGSRSGGIGGVSWVRGVGRWRGERMFCCISWWWWDDCLYRFVLNLFHFLESSKTGKRADFFYSIATFCLDWLLQG